MKKQFTCHWCGFQFSQLVRFVNGAREKGERHKSNGSAQIRCPKCANFIPTWKKELLDTKGMYGAKATHIHSDRIVEIGK